MNLVGVEELYYPVAICGKVPFIFFSKYNQILLAQIEVNIKYSIFA